MTHMDDSVDREPPRGIFDSLRALIDRVLAIVHNRAELLTTELEEELRRLVGVLLWAFVAVFAVLVGATFVALGIVFAIPDEYRDWVAGGIALLFFIIAFVGFRFIRKILHSKPRPFDASLSELEKDRKHLRGDS
jgi:uncharacterized membrane protein YqjE